MISWLVLCCREPLLTMVIHVYCLPWGPSSALGRSLKSTWSCYLPQHVETHFSMTCSLLSAHCTVDCIRSKSRLFSSLPWEALGCHSFLIRKSLTVSTPVCDSDVLALALSWGLFPIELLNKAELIEGADVSLVYGCLGLTFACFCLVECINGIKGVTLLMACYQACLPIWVH